MGSGLRALCAVIVFAFPRLVAAAAPPVAFAIEGQVVGSSSPRELWVTAFVTRDLRSIDARSLLAAPISSAGRFRLPVPSAEIGYFLVVSEACNPLQLGCSRYMPRLQPIRAGEYVRLEVPDLALAQRLWAGEGVEPGPARTVGIIAIGVLVALGLWLRRRPDESVIGVAEPWPAWKPAAGGLAFAILALWRLGDEPLDLLEYSYFHEALRPQSALALLRDSISAELAHGPVMPLVLRVMASVSVDPFWLRLASVVFGAGFVGLSGLILGRALGGRAGYAALVLAAVTPLALYYARDATPYALAGLLAVAAVAVVEPRRQPGFLGWTLFAALHVLGFFTHYGFAFFSLAQGLGLLVSGFRTRRRTIGSAALAFAAAAALPVWLAPHLETMLASSGLRFGLMAGAYPESPGLLAFCGRMAAVIAGGAADHAWSLVVWLLPAVIGGRELRRRAPTLLALVLACVALTALWLVFSHTMSVEYGGGRIYWAFRWARPLLVGFVLLAAAAAANKQRLVAASALPLALLGVVLSWQTVAPPVRPAQERVAARIRTGVEAGDAYAVMPASFYSDPFQYYLAAGSPPDLLTSMRTRDLPLGGATIRGPLVELRMPIETEISRLQHPRIWLVAYDEHMFGTRKFSPAGTEQLLAWLRRPTLGYTELAHEEAPFIDLWLFECGVECAWEGERSLRVALSDSVRAERFLERVAGTEGSPFDLPVTLVLPDNATELTVSLRNERAGVGRTSSVRLSGDSIVQTHAHLDRWSATLRPAVRPRVRIDAVGITAADLVFDVARTP